MHNDDEHNDIPWEPKPIPAAQFHAVAWANINRAPYDEVAGVTYKRSAHIKRVRYPAAVARWLFSEQPGTEEHLLTGATFEFLHDTTLAPGTSTEEHAHPATAEIVYVISGTGMLYHRPNESSPFFARPLCPGDAALIRGGTYHRYANEGTPADDTEDAEATPALRLLILGLTT
jgi:quercetin dioxygenase-like cupin family protein